MRSGRIWPAAIAALTTVALAAPAAAQANEVTNWNRIATNTLVAFPRRRAEHRRHSRSTWR